MAPLNKSILVVDDDSSIRTLVRTLLQREGFQVEEAESGNNAITQIMKKPFDAVVLDIMMGDGSGHDVLQTLAARRPDVKCVVVISATSQDNIEKVDTANVEARLRKPFDIGELLQAVRRCAGT
ncbi:MAG TPA: response regulator [Thermoanaerobaculia bacterium]|nr:response regulator [Thermoanaerobaculia bacterium]